MYKEYTKLGICNNRIFGVLLCLKQLLKHDGSWNDFVDGVEELVKKYEKVEIKTMGFLIEWKDLLK